MTALVILALMTGAALGVILMGMVAAGRREDECRACRRELWAFPSADCDEEWRDGTD